MTRDYSRVSKAFVFAFAALTIAACGGKEPKEKVATQAAARVNEDEISVHQINFALARVPSVDEQQAKQAGKQILERLIDQQLLVQKAMEAKLDRDPQVMQSIEAAKKEILAQAYLQRATASVAKGSADEIAKFYRERPELFSKRKLYRYSELAVSDAAQAVEPVRGMLQQGKSLNDVAAYLRENNIKFSAGSFEKAAEQLPMPILPKLQEMKPGQVGFLQNGPGFSLILVAEAKDAPISEKDAVPIIERYMQNQKRMQLAQVEMKQLRDKAQIEYMGNFADAQKSAEPSVAPKKTDQAEQKPANNESFMEKGLSDLK